LAPGKLQEKIREIASIHFDLHLASAVFSGKIPGDTFEIEKYFLENDRDEYALPVWKVQAPRAETKKILVWFHPGGKEEILKSKMLAAFIHSGYTVIAADLAGTGELRDPAFRGDGFVEGVPFNYTFGANLAGTSIPALQAAQIDLLMQFVDRQNPARVPVDAFAERQMVSPFLHYTVFRDPYRRVVLKDPLTSWESLIREKYYDPHWAFYVPPGALPWYDFEDLLSFIPQGDCKLVNPITSSNEKMEKEYDPEEILIFLERGAPGK
jgi:hypothetical protein